ncbi:hypothetical protein [Streptomyces sp. 3213.3]|uniref:hypothetical protein n=1 Tax=Streptomyces sp. 3213.3 TaxID=1855348 RepID=UPI00190E889D|nr:hypothetical protein [Streptomyces sp. 3213.3]
MNAASTGPPSTTAASTSPPSPDRAEKRPGVPDQPGDQLRAADAGHQLALELLVAPLHFRALLIRQPIEEDRIERMVDTLLHGVAGRGSTRTRPDSR